MALYVCGLEAGLSRLNRTMVGTLTVAKWSIYMQNAQPYGILKEEQINRFSQYKDPIKRAGLDTNDYLRSRAAVFK